MTEHRFRDPQGNEWVTVTPPSDDIIASYPAGTVEIPLDQVVEPEVTDDDILAELNRRLASGFDYDFGDARGVHHFGTTDADMRRWMDEVNPIAQAAVNVGAPNTLISIKTETGPVDITALEWFTILLTSGSTWRQPLWQAYFVLKAMQPRPRDYADDSYW